MTSLIKTAVRGFLSHGELDALRQFRVERAIAAKHRDGLRKIARKGLSRPARLNLGSGNFRKEGFLNVDLAPSADVTLDLRLGLPFETGCCQLIFSEHCFEHFDYPQPITHLYAECLRVLAPGGQLSFSVPDTEWPLIEYKDGAQAPYFKMCGEQAWHPDACTTRIEHINYHFRQGTEHRFAYDFETVEKVLNAVGFIDVRRRPFDPALDSKHREIGSLFVLAGKPRTGS